MKTKIIFIAYAPSGIHLGFCFLGASHAHAEAKRMAGSRGNVMEFETLEDALERFPEWEENIICDL